MKAAEAAGTPGGGGRGGGIVEALRGRAVPPRLKASFPSLWLLRGDAHVITLVG